MSASASSTQAKDEQTSQLPQAEVGKVYFWLFLFLILLFGTALRFYEISSRPFHNDEGVNWYFIEGMKNTFYYPYSHENYHGPSYFYLTRLFVVLFGDSEVAFRASAAVLGTLTPLLLLILLPLEGGLFVLIAASLLTFSTSLVFYSRYAIHETLFLFAGTLLALSLYAWAKTKLPKYIIYGALGLGLLIATKETFIIWLFSLGLALIATGYPHRSVFLKYVLRSYWGAGLLGALYLAIFYFLLNGAVFQANISNQQNDLILKISVGVLGLLALYCGYYRIPDYVRDFWSQRRYFGYASILIVVLVAATYSGGFIWGGGLRELSLAVQQWMGRNDSDVGHHKSFIYYTSLFWDAEPLLFLTALLPLLALPVMLLMSFVESKEEGLRIIDAQQWPLFRFLSFWSISTYLVYSFVKYKTPWLIINITLPLTLLLAWWIRQLFVCGSLGRFLGNSSLGLMLVVGFSYSKTFNYGPPCPEWNRFCYVHTTVGMLNLVRDIEAYWLKNPQSRVLVAVNGYWPLPYYLRTKAAQVHYITSDAFESYTKEYDILIMEKEVMRNEPAWARKYYRLSDVEETQAYFKRKLENK